MRKREGSQLPPEQRKIARQIARAIAPQVAEALAGREHADAPVVITIVAYPVGAPAGPGGVSSGGAASMWGGRSPLRDVLQRVAYAGWRAVDLSDVVSKVEIEEAAEYPAAAPATSD